MTEATIAHDVIIKAAPRGRDAIVADCRCGKWHAESEGKDESSKLAIRAKVRAHQEEANK